MGDYNNAPPLLAEEEEEVDRPFCLAETAALLLGILGTLILISGLGFFTVDPPGEEDLCQIETLGLQNKTKSDQDAVLFTCHALYAGVFNMLHAIAIPFILCGALALASTYLVVMAVHSRSPETTPSYFMSGLCANVMGLGMVAVPSMIYPSVTGIVAAGLTPIHAYFITIMVGHVAVEVSGATSNSTSNDPAVKMAADAYETLYEGYCAASRTELCLFVGSSCMLVLVGAYIFDILRSLTALTCMKPNYATTGCQLCKAHRLARKKKDQVAEFTNQQYNRVAPQPSPA